MDLALGSGSGCHRAQSRPCSLPSLPELAAAPPSAALVRMAAGPVLTPLPAPQGTAHQWPVTILPFREFTYHFQVALLVSTGRLCKGPGGGMGRGRGGVQSSGQAWGGVRPC